MKRIILYTMALLFATLQTFAQTYTYDSNNRLKKVVYDNGTTITYSYDALGNRTSKKVTGSTATKYTISISVTPSGSGYVTGGGTYTSGTSVELRAIPNAGYKFSKWSDGKTDNPLTIKVSGNQSFTAEFVESSSEIIGDVVPDGVINRQDLDALVDAYTSGTTVTGVTDIDTDTRLTIADVTKLISMLPQQGDEAPSIYNGHEYVDLGLPSGTLWATCNVGANSPEGYGCYFAWAETSGSCDGKTVFDYKNYKYNESLLGDNFTKYCCDADYGYNGFTDYLTELEAIDDAATVKWGGKWHTPTRTQRVELGNKKYTSWEWISVNGIAGWRITSIVEGYTDKSIFLPAAGMFDGKEIIEAGENGEYWTSSLYSQYSEYAMSMYFKSTSHGAGQRERSRGLTIRPVVSKNDISQ